MAVVTLTLIVLDEIQGYIIPLTSDELAHLEKSLVEEGCRDALVVWQRKEDELVLVDGHNRYKICQKHNIPFYHKVSTFSDIEHVKIWMIENQMGRRNLTQDQLSYYRGLKYLSMRKRKGGYENITLKGQEEHSACSLLSKEFNVSSSTIKRDSKFAEGLNMVGKTNPTLKLKILTGQLKVKKTEVRALPTTQNPEKLLQMLQESRLEKLKRARKRLSFTFETNEDRLNDIKTRIIRAMNSLISKRSKNDIDQFRSLITHFEAELWNRKA